MPPRDQTVEPALRDQINGMHAERRGEQPVARAGLTALLASLSSEAASIR